MKAILVVLILTIALCFMILCNDRGVEEQTPIPDTIRIQGSILDTPIRINPTTIIIISTDSMP